MKKLLLTALTGIALLTGIGFADFTTYTVSPSDQHAISGTVLSRAVQITNASGDAYMKVQLPQMPSHDIVYQNASLLPINNALLQLGAEHDPVFFIASGANISLTVTAKMTTVNWAFPASTVRFLGSDTGTFATLFTGINAGVSPIADLFTTKTISGSMPMFSGDSIQYIVTVTNIGSIVATGIQLSDAFPIPLFGLPSGIIGGTPFAYTLTYPNIFTWAAGPLYPLQPGQSLVFSISAPLAQQASPGTSFGNTARASTSAPEYTTGNNTASVTGVIAGPADLFISKTLHTFTGYQAGSMVTYTISYGNSGYSTAQNVSIQDIPSSEIHLTTMSRNIGSLPAGSGGILIVTGVLTQAMQAGQSFGNTVAITGSSAELSLGNNTAHVTGTIAALPNITLDLQANNISRPQLNTSPYGSGPNSMIQAVSGDIVILTIAYGNNGNTSANNATLSLAGLGGFVSFGTYNSSLGNLGLGQTGVLVITGIVGPQNYISFTPTATLSYSGNQSLSDSVSIQEPFVCGDGLITRSEPCDTLGPVGLTMSGQVCENHAGVCVAVTKNIINTACMTYWYTLGSGQICSTVQFPITSTSIGQCRSLDIAGSSIILANEVNGNYLGSAQFTCYAQSGNAQTISIDCGNGEIHTGTNTSSFAATCHFDETSIPRNRTVQCYVDGHTQDSCRQSVIVDQATFGFCGDGELDAREDCDLGANDEEIYSYLDEAETVRAGRYANDGYICHNCDIQRDDTLVPMAACFSLNENNVSIQEDEILPFRWNVDLMGSKTTTDCEDSSDEGKILRDSLTCEFRIFNGEKPESGKGSTFGDYDAPTVKTLTRDCDIDERVDGNGRLYPLFRYFDAQKANIWSLQNPYGRYALDFSDIDLDGVYGEYNIALYQVQYDYCKNGEAVAATPLDRVCESDFTVTKPYLAQKSSFGLTPKTTTINLDGYQDIFGNDIISRTDLNKIMVLDADEYRGGTNVNSLMTSFINKYSKLGVSVDKNKIDAFKGNDNILSIKIVPQQKIYIIESKAGTTLRLNAGDFSATPFTIVTRNSNLIVEGNLSTNGMFLVDNGTITFQETEKNRCASPQTVQGIFITNKGFAADEEGLANDATNKTWCAYGGLHVKGVLIGNSIDTLVQSRRSQLNHWFVAGSSNDAYFLAERRNEIFRGAAVLIEYSPSLRTALPPGADEFTKALDVYKK